MIFSVLKHHIYIELLKIHMELEYHVVTYSLSDHIYGARLHLMQCTVVVISLTDCLYDIVLMQSQPTTDQLQSCNGTLLLHLLVLYDVVPCGI